MVWVRWNQRFDNRDRLNKKNQVFNLVFYFKYFFYILEHHLELLVLTF
jgi:hypothetical protein